MKSMTQVCNDDGRKTGTNRINHSQRNLRPEGILHLTGATFKSNSEIESFNRKWISKNPDYDLAGENCQKYALDLAQYLTPGSFKLDLPASQVNAWADSANAHAISEGGNEFTDSI